MDPRLKLILEENPRTKALFNSALGTLMTCMEMVQGQSDTKKDPDLREKVTEALGNILMAVQPDPTSWTYVKHMISYSEYLRVRKQTGTITSYDMIRPGLTEVNFDNQFDYYEHYDRIRKHEEKMQQSGTSNLKTCNKCGASKPETAFRRGSTCNSCRGKAYRLRAAEREKEKEKEE